MFSLFISGGVAMSPGRAQARVQNGSRIPYIIACTAIRLAAPCQPAAQSASSFSWNWAAGDCVSTWQSPSKLDEANARRAASLRRLRRTCAVLLWCPLSVCLSARPGGRRMALKPPHLSCSLSLETWPEHRNALRPAYGTIFLFLP